MAGNVPDSDPQALIAKQIAQQMKNGADVSWVTKKYPVDKNSEGKPLWITKERTPGWWPFTWADIEKMKPGETTKVVTVYNDYASGDDPNQKYSFYYILRVNERRPARIAVTEETEKQKKALLDAEWKKTETAWHDSLEAKAKIQIFAQQ